MAWKREEAEIAHSRNGKVVTEQIISAKRSLLYKNMSNNTPKHLSPSSNKQSNLNKDLKKCKESSFLSLQDLRPSLFYVLLSGLVKTSNEDRRNKSYQSISTGMNTFAIPDPIDGRWWPREGSGWRRKIKAVAEERVLARNNKSRW